MLLSRRLVGSGAAFSSLRLRVVKVFSPPSFENRAAFLLSLVEVAAWPLF